MLPRLSPGVMPASAPIPPPLPTTQLTAMTETFIREWRVRRGLTQVELGDQLNVMGVTVHRWETGKVSPTVEQLRRISQALNCSVMELVRGPQEVAIIGRIVAGGEVVDSIDFPTSEQAVRVRCPDNCSPEDSAALRVGTEALWPFGSDWVLYFGRGTTGPNFLMIGRLCIAQVASDGRRFVRQIRQGSAPGLYSLVMPYWDDIEDAPIDWASPIVAARPLDADELRAGRR